MFFWRIVVVSSRQWVQRQRKKIVHTQHWDRNCKSTCYLTQSQYSDNRPAGPRTDPTMPSTWHGHQHASVSQGRTRSDNFCMLPHWDKSCRSNSLPHPVTVYWHQADQSQPITPGTWQGSHCSANFWVTGMTRPRNPEKIPAQVGFEPGIFHSQGGRLTTRPTRWSRNWHDTLITTRIIIIIIMIALKGAFFFFFFFYNFLSANCLQHIRSSRQDTIVCKSHATLIKCNVSCAMWYKETVQLQS